MPDDPTEFSPVRRRIHERIAEDQLDVETRPMFAVFLLTLVAVVVVPILGDWRWGQTVTVIVIGGSAVVALERSGAHRLLRQTSIGIVLFVATLVAISPAIEGHDAIEATATLLFALVLLVTPVVVIGRLLLRPKITLDTVSASLAGYLQIGLLFAALYSFVSQVQSAPFFATGSDVLPTFDFEYFSFITLCTVGYGDLTPGTNAGRTLAMLEAVIGQVFLVTIVAVVVGNLGRDLPHRRTQPVTGPTTEPGTAGTAPEPADDDGTG